jgi:uroporphyrinogen-III synthase
MPPDPAHTLAGRRVLVTRAPQQASGLADHLRALGATPILVPTIEIAPPGSFTALDAALASLAAPSPPDWLVFTSANAVEALHRRAQQLNLTPRPGRIAAIGPATARAVQAIGLTVDLVPPNSVAESLAGSLLPHAPGQSFLLVRAAEARDVLPEALIAAGATVTIAEAYRNRLPHDSLPALQSLFASPEACPHAVTFTSASTARNLVALLESAGLALPSAVLRASIGPITSQALRDLGLPPHLEAAEPTIPALCDAMASAFHTPADGTVG